MLRRVVSIGDEVMRQGFPKFVILLSACILATCLPVLFAAELPCKITLADTKKKEDFIILSVGVKCEISSEHQHEDIPMLLGLSAIKGEEGDADTDYDFALQHVSPASLRSSEGLTFVFKAHRSDLLGRNSLDAKIWPMHYLEPCLEGRSGCKKYGYALGESEASPEHCSDGNVFCEPSEGFRLNISN